MSYFKETMIKKFTLLFFAVFVFGCKNEIEKDQNSLKGKVYTQISEIPELKDFEFQAGSMIDYEGKSSHEYKFGVSQFFDKDKYLIILEEKQAKGKKTSNKILDTIMIKDILENESISLCTCRINGKGNSEIIAVVKNESDENEYLKKVVKAWKVDSKAGKIFPINNLKEIDCVNEGYGL